MLENRQLPTFRVFGEEEKRGGDVGVSGRATGGRRYFGPPGGSSSITFG
jgi:hypothetical protein